MKTLKIILIGTLLIFSINITHAQDISDNCKNTVNKSDYPSLTGGLIDKILNIGDKLHKKVLNKNNNEQISYFSKLTSILNGINTISNTTKGEIIGLLKEDFNCKIDYLKTNNSGNSLKLPNINDYSFIIGEDTFNKDEIHRYFNDMKQFQKGKDDFFDMKGLRKVLSYHFAGTNEERVKYFPEYTKWYKANILKTTQYWHRTTSNMRTIPDFILNGSQGGNIFNNTNERIIALQISAKILEELMPSGYRDYPDTNVEFDNNKYKIRDWFDKNHIITHKYKYTNDNIIKGVRSGILSIAYQYGSYKIFGGRFESYIGGCRDPESCYGPASGTLVSKIPKVSEMCPGLFMLFGRKLDRTQNQIKYGKNDHDDTGGLQYKCYPITRAGHSNHSIGGKLYLNRTIVFKIYSGKKIKGEVSFGIEAKEENAIKYCFEHRYRHGKILSKVKGKPNRIINYIDEKNYTRDAYNRIITTNNTKKDIIEAIKCWNGNPTPDPIGFGDLINKGKYESEIINGTRVINATSNYYWKVIYAIPYPDMPIKEYCNKTNLNIERKANGGTIYKCSEKEELF